MNEKADINTLLSIILPTYNERENVAILIPQLVAIFKDISHEIIVVDDSSTDGTIAEVESLAKRFSQVHLIIRGEKRGIGSALRAGYHAARGQVILSSDSDLSFSADDLRKLYSAVDGGADLAVGSRHTRHSLYETPSLKILLKYIVSRWGNALLAFIFRIPVRDFSANCRAIRKGLWHILDTREDTNFFLFEMILLAKERGAKIVEVPVSFLDRRFGESKIRHLTEIPKAFYKMLAFLARRHYKKFFR